MNIEQNKKELIHRLFRLNNFAEKLGELNKKHLLRKTSIVNNFLLVVYNTEIAIQVLYCDTEYNQAVRIAKNTIETLNKKYFSRSDITIKDLIYAKTEESDDGFLFFKRKTMYEMLSIKEDVNGSLWLYDFKSVLMNVDEYFKDEKYSQETQKKSQNITRDTERRFKKYRKIDNVLYLYSQNFTVKEIIEMTGISEKTVYKYINEEFQKSYFYKNTSGKEEKSMKEDQVKMERNNKIIMLYKKNLSQQQIADKLNVSRSLVSKVLNKNKDLYDSKKDKISKRDLEIIRLRDAGLTQEEIAKEIGCARTTVTRVLKENKEKGILEANGWKSKEDIIAESKAIAKKYMEEQRKNEENN